MDMSARIAVRASERPQVRPHGGPFIIDHRARFIVIPGTEREDSFPANFNNVGFHGESRSSHAFAAINAGTLAYALNAAAAMIAGTFLIAQR
jgi:hypothetical protein